jgi:hypothetical protein
MEGANCASSPPGLSSATATPVPTPGSEGVNPAAAKASLPPSRAARPVKAVTTPDARLSRAEAAAEAEAAFKSLAVPYRLLRADMKVQVTRWVLLVLGKCHIPRARSPGADGQLPIVNASL